MNHKDRVPVGLTPAMFHILLSLADRPSHGYAIMLDVEALTGDEGQLPPGTLYRSIKQLLEAGLIERTGPEREPVPHETRRQYYRISRAGRKAVTVEAERLARLVDRARAKRLIPHAGSA